MVRMTDSAPARPDRMRRRIWRHPAVMALAAALAIVAASFLPTLWHMHSVQRTGQSPASRDAPWDADITADGAVRALGLRLPGSTLADAQALWGDGLQVALIVSGDGPPALEASVEQARPGGVAGRLLLTAQASASQLQRYRDGAVKDEQTSPKTWRLSLRSEDLADALRAPLSSIGFIPQAQLDAALLRRRFGEPREIVVESPTREHWLYPERGLGVVLDADGRELLQFVPPRQFEALLRSPLRQAVPRDAASAPPG